MPEARNTNTMSSFADSCPETNTKENQALDFIHHVTSHADEVQAQVLHEILSKNSNTEYLRRHGLNGLTDRESFKKIVPIITYEDVQPYILRIANGDKSPILCSTPISEFLTSSGTSGGERKMMPTIPEELDRKELLYGLLMPVINQYVKDLDKGKAMYFCFVKAESKTPGGLLARPVLTSYYRSKQFQEKPYDPFNACTSPMEAILCTDVAQSMYSQMLCGLAQNREVFRIGAVFASGLLRAIRFLQENWGELCNDLRNGTVSEKRVQDPEVRRGVMRTLRADPALAEEIETECSKECWKGILQRLWPNTKYLEVVVTGAMAQYIPTLDFFSGGLPKVCVMYASSECYFGINLKPMAKPSEVSYTLLPNMGYFEFIPVRRDEEENGSSETEEPVELVDVKVGVEYELIVTTYAGLYRYKVGDILKVTGFHNNAPQFSFVCRKNVALSIDSDKTDEVELHRAVTRATKELEHWGVSLVEYTSHADATTIPGHYVLYWELSGAKEELPTTVMESCCAEVEESLNSVYRQCRSSDKSIGPLEIRVVETGTFDRMMDYAINNGSSVNQYKAPRCVTSEALVQLLNCNTKACFFSPRVPYWKPRSQWNS